MRERLNKLLEQIDSNEELKEHLGEAILTKATAAMDLDGPKVAAADGDGNLGKVVAGGPPKKRVRRGAASA